MADVTINPNCNVAPPKLHKRAGATFDVFNATTSAVHVKFSSKAIIPDEADIPSQPGDLNPYKFTIDASASPQTVTYHPDCATQLEFTDPEIIIDA